MRLEGQTAIVTGGGRGIGRAIAIALAKEGANVVVAARTLSEVEHVAEDIHGMGRRAVAVRTDISNKAEVHTLVDRATGTFGQVDILVNNAGVHGPIVSVVDLDMEDFQRAVDINLKGVILSTQAVLPQMIERRRGKIINISSMHARRGAPYLSAYSITKAGIVAFTQSLAREVAGSNINVHAITAHGIDTDMSRTIMEKAAQAAGVDLEERRKALLVTTKWGYYPHPEAIAPLVVFLASPESDPMTEQIIDFP